METPPPSDTLQASPIPPVEGFRSFRGDWQTNICSANVLSPMATSCHSFENHFGQISSDSVRI